MVPRLAYKLMVGAGVVRGGGCDAMRVTVRNRDVLLSRGIVALSWLVDYGSVTVCFRTYVRGRNCRPSVARL